MRDGIRCERGWWWWRRIGPGPAAGARCYYLDDGSVLATDRLPSTRGMSSPNAREWAAWGRRSFQCLRFRIAPDGRAGADPVLWGLRCPEGTTAVCQSYGSDCGRLKPENGCARSNGGSVG